MAKTQRQQLDQTKVSEVNMHCGENSFVYEHCLGKTYVLECRKALVIDALGLQYLLEYFRSEQRVQLSESTCVCNPDSRRLKCRRTGYHIFCHEDLTCHKPSFVVMLHQTSILLMCVRLVKSSGIQIIFV